jgi:hypothetical protein
MRSTGSANDGVGLQQNVAGGQIGFFHPLQHRYHGHRTDLGAILVLIRLLTASFSGVYSNGAKKTRETFWATYLWQRCWFSFPAGTLHPWSVPTAGITHYFLHEKLVNLLVEAELLQTSGNSHLGQYVSEFSTLG